MNNNNTTNKVNNDTSNDMNNNNTTNGITNDINNMNTIDKLKTKINYYW